MPLIPGIIVRRGSIEVVSLRDFMPTAFRGWPVLVMEILERGERIVIRDKHRAAAQLYEGLRKPVSR
jgi:hypothetical protein